MHASPANNFFIALFLILGVTGESSLFICDEVNGGTHYKTIFCSHKFALREIDISNYNMQAIL